MISVPASTANLGPGFDCLGIGLDLRAEIGTEDEVPVSRAEFVDDGHPAVVAFRRAGGSGRLWVRSPIPAGRGLGFSGAMRVGGVVAAHVQSTGAMPDRGQMLDLLAIASELEGHPDNVAASMFGGFTAAAGRDVISLPVEVDLRVVVWVPSTTATSTDRSRQTLPSTVALSDAAFNIGRTALLVGALVTGDLDVLREATRDALHQAVRLEAVPSTAMALRSALASPAVAAWLSGSGPSVAALCRPADAATVASVFPPSGHTKILDVASTGPRLTPPPAPTPA